jgi:hypothetical protein
MPLLVLGRLLEGTRRPYHPPHSGLERSWELDGAMWMWASEKVDKAKLALLGFFEVRR